MAATASALPPLSPRGAGGVEQEDSNISSPLSEVDDKDDNDEEIEHMQLDHDDNEETIVIGTPKKAPNQPSDTDSVLSDAHSDVNSDANDTEAETERLYDTPKHQRQRDVAVDQFGEGQIFEHTPSKLRRPAAGDDDAKHGDEESLSGDDVSIGSSGPGVDSPSKPATTKDTSVDDEHKLESQERKRKRSPGADQSETEQPLRKRTSSVAEHEKAALQPDDDTVMQEDEATPANDASGSQSPVEETESSSRKQPTVRDEDETERETRAIKKNTRGSKRKVAVAADADHETGGDSGAGHDTEQHGEATDPDVDDEIDAVTAHDEEMERKHAAYKDWTHIEEMFGVFRDRLYKDRLERLEEEEKSLLASKPTHPEYLNMKQCLDDRLNQKLREINNELEYRMKAHEKRAVALRAQMWGQYYQAVREKREKALEGLNKEWYDVQTARRTAHSVQDCGLMFPKDPAQRVRNAIAYNTEVSALASIAKYEGFPAGPEMKGASATELEDDLAAIERSRRGRQKLPVQPREDYQPPTFSRLGPAGEQFLKETPWANPNHSSHKVYSQLPGAMDGRIDTGPGRQGAVPSLVDIKSTFEGSSSKQRSPALSSRLSESPELARTMLNPAHHQMKRVGSLSGINRGSKTAAT